ncbi:MAG: 1-acyl-sn-glycerol-3-phosphate acyltransferase [Chloroflexota bacterium]
MRAIVTLLARIITLPIVFIWLASGWRAQGALPAEDKFMVVAAPHTSNWDYIMMICLASYYGRRPKTVIKSTALRWPLVGIFIRWLGGIPVDRTRSTNAVQQVVDIINQHNRIVLVIAPEGTRRRVDHWRRGFYYMAHGANIPIAIGYLDYEKKRIGVCRTIMPSGDIDADMEIIQACYAQYGHGKFPDKATPVTLQPVSDGPGNQQKDTA